jgi:hypothetical protein
MNKIVERRAMPTAKFLCFVTRGRHLHFKKPGRIMPLAGFRVSPVHAS